MAKPLSDEEANDFYADPANRAFNPDRVLRRPPDLDPSIHPPDPCAIRRTPGTGARSDPSDGRPHGKGRSPRPSRRPE